MSDQKLADDRNATTETPADDRAADPPDAVSIAREVLYEHDVSVEDEFATLRSEVDALEALADVALVLWDAAKYPEIEAAPDELAFTKVRQIAPMKKSVALAILGHADRLEELRDKMLHRTCDLEDVVMKFAGGERVLLGIDDPPAAENGDGGAAGAGEAPQAPPRAGVPVGAPEPGAAGGPSVAYSGVDLENLGWTLVYVAHLAGTFREDGRSDFVLRGMEKEIQSVIEDAVYKIEDETGIDYFERFGARAIERRKEAVAYWKRRADDAPQGQAAPDGDTVEQEAEEITALCYLACEALRGHTEEVAQGGWAERLDVVLGHVGEVVSSLYPPTNATSTAEALTLGDGQEIDLREAAERIRVGADASTAAFGAASWLDTNLKIIASRLEELAERLEGGAS